MRNCITSFLISQHQNINIVQGVNFKYPFCWSKKNINFFLYIPRGMLSSLKISRANNYINLSRYCRIYQGALIWHDSGRAKLTLTSSVQQNTLIETVQFIQNFALLCTKCNLVMMMHIVKYFFFQRIPWFDVMSYFFYLSDTSIMVFKIACIYLLVHYFYHFLQVYAL